MDYFPSYEMILGPHSRGAFLADDLREVRPEGVQYAMSKFAAHYLGEQGVRTVVAGAAPSQAVIEQQKAAIQEIASVICDEEKIDTCSSNVV